MTRHLLKTSGTPFHDCRSSTQRSCKYVAGSSMPNESGARMVRTLTGLPVELIEEIYLFALSPTFPQTCKYIHSAVKSFPPFVHAHYILGRHPPKFILLPNGTKPTLMISSTLAEALRYPISTIPVLIAMRRVLLRSGALYNNVSTSDAFELPKRLFRTLSETDAPLDVTSDPLPLLQFLWEKGTEYDFPQPMPDSHSGYPLVRAVHARFIPLVRFLLDHGADPGQRGCLAVKVAIGKKDLMLVKMLIEYELEPTTSAKKRRMLDRIVVEPFLLDMAVRCDARDIVQYFMEDKGCIPNMRTLKAVRCLPTS